MREEELVSRLEALETRVAQLEKTGVRWRTAGSVVPLSPAPLSPAGNQFDVAIVAKCILIIGGAYVLRALTELKVLPNGVGVALGFGYALFWIWRSRTILFAATGAGIAGALSWEAATRFHIIGAAGGGALIAIAALVLLWIARTRAVPIYAAIAGAMAIVSSIGVAIGTADALPAALTVAAIGVVISTQTEWDTYLTAGIAAANDSIAITLIALTMFNRTPHDPRIVQAALIAIAIAWLIAPMLARVRNHDERLRWPEIGQAIVATMIGLGGASFVAQSQGGDSLIVSIAAAVIATVAYALALRVSRTAVASALALAGAFAAAVAMVLLLDGAVLASFWSIAGMASAAIARRITWPLLFIHAAVWSAGGLIIGFGTTTALIVAASLAAVALLLIPSSTSSYSRLTLLGVASGAVVITIMRFAPATTRSMTAFEWTSLLAIAIAVLSLLSPRLAEAATLARILLIAAGIKIVVEDLRVGQATTLVASLALYGGAMLLFARRRKPLPVVAAAPPVSPDTVTSIV
jgi:hypothetical protein